MSEIIEGGVESFSEMSDQQKCRTFQQCLYLAKSYQIALELMGNCQSIRSRFFHPYAEFILVLLLETRKLPAFNKYQRAIFFVWIGTLNATHCFKVMSLQHVKCSSLSAFKTIEIANVEQGTKLQSCVLCLLPSV